MAEIRTDAGAGRRSRSLETATVDFLDLIGNGKHYSVPAYQRDYSWDEEHWDDLWSDIVAMADAAGDRHYMGAIVLQATSDREFMVIDGQQRLATLSILALAIIRNLNDLVQAEIEPEENRERSAFLRRRYIGEKDPASLIESSKLSLNATDDPFYQDYLVQLKPPRNPRGLPGSSRRMWRCFEWFCQRIDHEISGHHRGKDLASLLNEVIARRLLFIRITVDDALSAYTVFETLNARGLELSAADLLKNYLFSKIRVAADLLALQRRWLRLIQTVSQESFAEFLRYHLLCELPRVKPGRLFQTVRDRVTTPDDVFRLLEALEGRSDLFAALSDPSHEYWSDIPEAKRLVRERILLGGQHELPVLFAAWVQFDRRDFIRVLKLTNVVTFRYAVICSLNTNELEPVYHKVAKSILARSVSGPREVFDLLSEVYVTDRLFSQSFASVELRTVGAGRKLVKYILCRLETDLSQADVDFETDSGTIEHILPENPAGVWANSVPVQEWEKLVYRLGNLTLLESAYNRAVGNGPIAEKLVMYGRSRYAITRRIASQPPEEWNAAQLELRQSQLAERAVHVWRSDFC